MSISCVPQELKTLISCMDFEAGAVRKLQTSVRNPESEKEMTLKQVQHVYNRICHVFSVKSTGLSLLTVY